MEQGSKVFRWGGKFKMSSAKISINMFKVKADTFLMGGGDIELRPDALPIHKVRLSSDFYISEEPIPYDLFEKFYREKHHRQPDVQNYQGYVIGVSWYEADEFCRWLSEKEADSYRLPTEAEWEYCARNSREIGTDRMCDLNMREWCFDWYAAYSEEETDPAGPDSGHFKVVRGGFLDDPARYNAYPLEVWMRCSLPPDFRHDEEDRYNEFGRHPIGFRVVRGRTPKTSENSPIPLVCLNVKQSRPVSRIKEDTPYFRKRYLFPVPPDNASSREILAMGLNPSLRHHNHSPGFDVAPNGDLIVSIYSSYHEYDAEVGLMAARLRYGSEEWEAPDMFLNAVGVNDHAPLIYTDRDGTMYHFWGWPELRSAYPFQYTCSKDSGATWSAIQFPRFTNHADRIVRQPVNTAFHAKDGYYYVVCDASDGAASVLWRSRDLIHWENPRGRTAGRHSTAVELRDGRLLAMGGKNSDIDGYMPKAVSSDHGDSWEVSRTPFPACSSGQRPCILRLQSGRLLMCGDFQTKKGKRPKNATEKEWGSYAAYSEDEGETWTLKKLWGTQKRKKNPEQFHGAHTIGYSVCRQSQDGLIHVITSNNHPCLHLCFNEAWLLSAEEPSPGDPELMRSKAFRIDSVKTYTEKYENGNPKCVYSGGIADDGRFLLHGEERWFYPSGDLMTYCTYKMGERIGEYIYYDRTGDKIWSWEYLEDHNAIYRTYYKGNVLKSTGRYKGKIAQGMAQSYSRNGALVSEVLFDNGKMIKEMIR